MAPSKMRKALGAVKDRTSISLAKVGHSTMSDIDVLIVKATRHEEQPADERYVREILSMTSYSRGYVSSCVNTLAKRLNKTKNWTVALKTLILIHRFLSEGDPAYEQELFYATRRGTRLLNMSDFRDKSQSGSWDFSAFVRTFALYLDEQLEFRMHLHGHRPKRPGSFGGDEDDELSPTSSQVANNTPVREMKTEGIFTRISHLQQLLERFLACRPTGPAKDNHVVLVAVYLLVKESFNIYYDITEIMGILIERFMALSIQDCIKVHDIFTRISKQFDELDSFYNWSKSVAVARSSEFPEVERIEPRKLIAMDDFISERIAMAQQSKSPQNKQPKREEVVEEEEEEEEVDENFNEMKALPAPPPKEKVEEPPKKEEVIVKEKEPEREADLLNLREDQMTGEDQGDKLALALFDGNTGAASSTTTEWVPFPSNDPNWESALVESASNMKNQKTDLGGGFDTLLLEGMYKHNPQQQNNQAFGSGSASSVVVPQHKVLALPAPPVPTENGGGSGVANTNIDPFAASLSVAPPTYVQMSEMQMKQKLLVEEQFMWEQYGKDRIQGRVQQAPAYHDGRGSGYNRF